MTTLDLDWNAQALREADRIAHLLRTDVPKVLCEVHGPAVPICEHGRVDAMLRGAFDAQYHDECTARAAHYVMSGMDQAHYLRDAVGLQSGLMGCLLHRTSLYAGLSADGADVFLRVFACDAALMMAAFSEFEARPRVSMAS